MPRHRTPKRPRHLQRSGQMYRVPRATYRLQLNAGFTFADARRIVPYLAELGVSDLYTSPILKARKGSTHGYDVVDAATLNPELGSDEDFTALHHELHQRDLGLLLDVVPNHMAASPDNAWWMSVLENGPHSRFLHYFDIDWNPVTTRGQTVNKCLLPILGKPYGEALESKEIRLGFDAEGFFFQYYDTRLPLAPQSYARVLRDCVDTHNELHELVQAEADVPNSKFLKETLWRIYEQDATFRQALDSTIDRFNAEIDALDDVLDHQWYRLAYWRLASQKITYRRFFVDSAGLEELDQFYRAFTGITESFADICYERKKQVIQELFSGEMRALGKKLSAVAMADRNARDFAPVDLTAALTEVTACLNVYRTYIRDDSPSKGERCS